MRLRRGTPATLPVPHAYATNRDVPEDLKVNQTCGDIFGIFFSTFPVFSNILGTYRGIVTANAVLLFNASISVAIKQNATPR
jgi:hypothetical protein